MAVCAAEGLGKRGSTLGFELVLLPFSEAQRGVTIGDFIAPIALVELDTGLMNVAAALGLAHSLAHPKKT